MSAPLGEEAFEAKHAKYVVKVTGILGLVFGVLGTIIASLSWIPAKRYSYYGSGYGYGYYMDYAQAITHQCIFPIALVLAHIWNCAISCRPNPVANRGCARANISFSIIFGIFTYIAGFITSMCFMAGSSGGMAVLTAIVLIFEVMEVVLLSVNAHFTLKLLRLNVGDYSHVMDSSSHQRLADLESKVNMLMTTTTATTVTPAAPVVYATVQAPGQPAYFYPNAGMTNAYPVYK